MKPSYWILVFLIALCANIIGIQLSIPWLELASKPLLIPLLIIFFLSQKPVTKTNLTKWVLFALAFSWLGDVLLMFVPQNENFFLVGLGSFLLAHIFYIILFHQIKKRERIANKLWAVLAVALYYGGLIYLLSPHLGEMRLPVRIYGIVISFMCMLALHLFSITDIKTGTNIATGALLFVLSDSVLAINKFYQPLEMGGLGIMLTYGLAQLFIVKGTAAYISSK